MFSRQPIVDETGRLSGYELRVPPGSGSALAAVAHAAEVGLPAVPMYLTVEPGELLGPEPLPFDPGLAVVQLATDVLGTTDLLQRLDAEIAAGHRFGLVGHPGTADPAVLRRVTSASVDAALLTGGSADHLAGLTIVAANVVDPTDVARCRTAGAALFQGPFLTRAPAAASAGAAPASVSRLRTAAALQSADGLEEVERAVSMDGVLSIGLLRFVNSAAFSLRSQVNSVHHAVALLGPRTVRQWATAVVLSGAAPSPRWRVLGVTGLARARTCESIARRQGEPDPESYFLVGLLSVTGALLEMSLESLLAELPLADDIVQALTTRAGPKGHALAVAEACERGDWARAQLPAMDAELLAILHAAALRWSDAAVAGLA